MNAPLGEGGDTFVVKHLNPNVPNFDELG